MNKSSTLCKPTLQEQEELLSCICSIYYHVAWMCQMD